MNTFFNKNDENFFYNAYGQILNLLGSNNIKKINEKFLNRIGYVKSHPKGFSNDKVNALEPGKSGYINEDIDGKMFLEFIGTQGSENPQLNEHYVRHELTHIFETVVHDTFAVDNNTPTNNQGIPLTTVRNINGSNYAVINGTIYKQKKDNEPNNTIYGGGLCELFTDFMAIASKVHNDERYQQQVISIDSVMKQPTDFWNIEGITTGYMGVFPIIQLMISAFSNSSDINYQKLIESGDGILFSKDKNGNKKIVNDCIYGLMCDPFYLMEQCDKIAGEQGYYFKLCNKIDKIVNDCAYNRNYNLEEVNDVVNDITQLSIRRVKMKCAEGSMSINEGIKILEEFQHTEEIVKNQFNPSSFHR